MMETGWQRINELDEKQAGDLLRQCCGSSRWAKEMLDRRPFVSLDTMITVADEIWDSLNDDDWLEAFTHHPRIGEKTLREKFASTANWASFEQSGIAAATEDILRRLTNGNEAYYNKFGYIFIVCATGKSADKMLSILESRLPNSPADEIKIAAAEQKKITHIRLRKL
jgi:2-oxo-4-hydroxy-4-carboxy-5-ureidoimidazoline decarboxylase